MEHPTWKHLTHLTPATCSKPSPLPDREEHAIFTPNLTQTKKLLLFPSCTAPSYGALLGLAYGWFGGDQEVFPALTCTAAIGAHKGLRFCSLQGVLVWSLFSFP